MKLISFAILFFICGAASAQTVIPAITTVDSLSRLPKGSYRFFTIAKKDTVDLSKDTIPKCPACPRQRTVRSYRVNATTRKTTFTYDDGSTSTL